MTTECLYSFSRKHWHLVDCIINAGQLERWGKYSQCWDCYCSLYGSQTCGKGAWVAQWSSESSSVGHPQDGQLTEKSSDQTWSTAGGKGNSLQYCLENPMNSMKKQKDMTPENEPLRSEGVQYATGEEQRAITNSSRKNEASGPKRKQCSVMNVSGGERKVQCCKEQYC